MNLNQVTVPSLDVRRSIDSYGRLGLVLIVDDLPGYARFECPDGDATFSVEDRKGTVPGVVVYFECADLEAKVSALKEGGVVMDSERQGQPWLWREAYLKDPDGNVIYLFSAGENPQKPAVAGGQLRPTVAARALRRPPVRVFERASFDPVRHAQQ